MDWSEENRLISQLRQKQKDRPIRRKHKEYPKRTKKIWDDRIKAAENIVARNQEWYDSAVERSSGRSVYGWGDPPMLLRWLESAQKQLERVKAEAAKALGAQP